MMERDPHGVGDVMEMESSGRLITQPRLLVMWSSSRELTDVGEMNIGDMNLIQA